MRKSYGSSSARLLMKVARRVIFQDALVKYLAGGSADQEKREAAYQVYCERPFKLDAAQFREILEADAWDQ